MFPRARVRPAGVMDDDAMQEDDVEVVARSVPARARDTLQRCVPCPLLLVLSVGTALTAEGAGQGGDGEPEAGMSPQNASSSAPGAGAGASSGRNPIVLHLSSPHASTFAGSPILASALDDSAASSVAPSDSPMWPGMSANLSASISLQVEVDSAGVGPEEAGDGREAAQASGATDAADAAGGQVAGADDDHPLTAVTSANSVPRTREEWNARLDGLCDKLTARPLAYTVIEDVLRQVRILVDGRKALKMRRNPIRKGDMVLANGDGDDLGAQRRGVIETDNGDGSYMVKWLSPIQETVRVEAHDVKVASRYQGGLGGPQAHNRVNMYLVQRAIPDKNSSMVEELLREGADADHTDETGTPALLLAINKRCPHQIINSLLKHGADPDLAGPTQTPLQAAMANNDSEVVNALLKNGCDCSKVDPAALAACTSRVADVIRQYATTTLSDEARAQLQKEGMAKLMPLVVAACGQEIDLRCQLSALNMLAHLMDQLSAMMIQEIFPARQPKLAKECPPTKEQQITDELMKVMLQFTQGEGCDALDAIYGLLRIVQSIIEKAPHLVSRLRRSGLIRWVQRLSNSAQTKQDVQAKLLQSKTGRIKDKHVSKLAMDILTNLPQASPHDLCAAPDLLAACEALRQRQPRAFYSLASVLAQTQETSPHDLAVCDVAGAMLEALSGPDEQRAVQWEAFVAAFCPSPEEELALVAEGGPSATGQIRNSKLDCLIAPLVELIGTEEFWPIHASGESRRGDGSVLASDELQVLTTPIRLDLTPRSQPTVAVNASAQTCVLAPRLTLHVEPLLRVNELERHLLRICTPPKEYVALCHYLVGATIEERSGGNASAPLRPAVVIGFEMQPADNVAEPKDPVGASCDVCMEGSADIELDNSTRASCLTSSVEGACTVVTCQSKGSPAGTVQASRPFSNSLDGALAYYETTIRKRGPTGAIGVGLARAGYSNNKMPGWEPVSHAWHGDDGCTFNSCGTGTPLSQPWQEGDVIGCGIDFKRSAVFFTRNGLLQPGPLRGVDTEGLLATLGFQTKGECVSVSFGPNFLYDLSAHDLSPPQVPVHRIRYLDGPNEEKSVNLLAREYVVVETPALSAFEESLRCALCHFKAENPPQAVHKALLALWMWLKPILDAGEKPSRGKDLPAALVENMVSCGHGECLLRALGLVNSVESGHEWSLQDLQEPAAITRLLQDLNVVEESESTAGSQEAEAARDQTVLIVIPDGFPAELFFEEVEDHVRHALSAPDPLVAPASGHIGDQYRWPDRGYDHEESWYESLTAALTEGHSGAVARGQTRYEAETLVARLSHVVQCRVTTDNSQDYTQRARDAKRSQGGVGSGLCVGDRVQVSTGDKEWKLGNLLSVEETQRFMVICDDGTVLTSVPQDHIKGLRSNSRGWPPRGRGVAAEMQELMMRDHRMLEQLGMFSFPQIGSLRTQAVADIRRKFSSFEIGNPRDRDRPVYREGVTPPKHRLELWNDAAPAPEAMEAKQTASFTLPSPPVEAVLTLPRVGGEMHKIKSAAQLQASLDSAAQGVVGVLLIDAQARPPAGHSWPRPIHSASTLVKELSQRFGQATFLRILSGTTPGCLQQFGLERSGFRPTFILMLAGREEARWEQHESIEVLWAPVNSPTASASSTMEVALVDGGSGSSPASLKRVVHRNEMCGLLERGIDHWIASGRLPDPSSLAAPLASSQTVYACLQAAGSIGDPKPTSHAMQFCLKLREDVGLAELVRRLKGEGCAQHEGRSEGPGSCKMEDVANHGAHASGSPAPSGRDSSFPGQSVSPQVCSALDVVKLLHDRLGPRRGDKRRWQSQWLTKRLMCQLQDALVFGSCWLPQWCLSIPRSLPFLFSLESRQRLLDCTGFGSSHALYRFQEHKVAAYRAKHAESLRQSQQQLARAREQQDIDAISRASDDLDIIEQRMYSKRIGAIASDLARVARGSILENAVRLVDLHHSSKHVLEVQFHEEDGFGSGVTQNFYEAVSVALQLRSFNDSEKLWVSDGRDSDCKLDPEGPFKYLINADGLFPQPLLPDAAADVVEKCVGRFRFIGRLLGKACRDKFTVPLPLHAHFFELVKGGYYGTTLDMLRAFCRGRDTLLPSDEWTPQHLLEAYCTVVLEARERSKGVDVIGRKALYAELHAREFMSRYLNRSYQCSLGDFLASSGATFKDPLTGAPLCAGGADRALQVENLDEYVELVAIFWFDTGVGRQIKAFRAGINDVFPFSSLQIFSAAEMEVMLCGERSIDWDKDSLQQHIKLVSNEQGARYNKKSQPFLMLLDELVAMPIADRARFLDFVTACPRLPPGGLASLGIEIAPENRSRYPRSRTCSKLMWLPSYDTQGELHEKLRAALANAKEGGFHEVQEALVVATGGRMASG